MANPFKARRHHNESSNLAWSTFSKREGPSPAGSWISGSTLSLASSQRSLATTASISSLASSQRSLTTTLSSLDASLSNIFEEDSGKPLLASRNHPAAKKRLHTKRSLPCEFTFLGCATIFQEFQVDSWISHTLSHFGALGPPKQTSCTICGSVFISLESSRQSWRERTLHILGHRREEAKFESFNLDYLTIAYLYDSGLCSLEDYCLALQRMDFLGSHARQLNQSSSQVLDENGNHEGETQEDNNEKTSHTSIATIRSSTVTPPLQKSQLLGIGTSTLSHDLLTKESESNESQVQAYSRPKELQKSPNYRALFKEIRSRNESRTAPATKEGSSAASDRPARKIVESSPDQRHEYIAGSHGLSDCTPTAPEQDSLPAMPIESKSSDMPSTHQVEAEAPGDTPSNLRGSCPSVEDPSNADSRRPRSPGSSLFTLGTDSTFSADITDWEEDSMIDLDMSIVEDDIDIYIPTDRPTDSSIKKQMTASQRRLLQVLMNDFWQSFEAFLSSHAGFASDKGSSSTGPSVKQSSSSRGRSSKRPRDGEEEESDNDGKRNPKRKSNDTVPSNNVEKTQVRFACPYRKHNRAKYSLPTWKTCVLTPHTTVARVKGHLYNYHSIHQCQRCKELFNSEADLDEHVEAIEGCPSRSGPPVDGITSKIKERLRTRKKSCRDQTEEDRWFQIYQILFEPEERETIPSPYFEPILERDETTTDARNVQSRDADSLEGYVRHQLPRSFETVLEDAVTREMYPIEERLRQDLVSLMQMAYNNTIAGWRALHDPAPAGSESSLRVVANLDPPEFPLKNVPNNSEFATSQMNSYTLPALGASSEVRIHSSSRTSLAASDPGYVSDLLRFGKSQQTSSASSEWQSDLPSQPDERMAFPLRAHQVMHGAADTHESVDTGDDEGQSFVGSQREYTSGHNLGIMRRQEEAQELSTQNSLMFNDDFGNLDLEYSTLNTSWDHQRNHDFPF